MPCESFRSIRTTPAVHACLGTTFPGSFAISFVQNLIFTSIILSPCFASSEAGGSLSIAFILISHVRQILSAQRLIASLSHWYTKSQPLGVGVEAEQVLANRLEMLLPALQLLRHGVDVAKPPF